MKINLNVPILDLDKNPIAETSIGKTISQVLVSATKGDSIKMLEWAFKLHAGHELELDKSDYETLKTFVTNCDQLTVLAKGQALEILNAVK